MLGNLDNRRQLIADEFLRLLTQSADPSYCGTIGVEVKVHRGEVRDAHLPQSNRVNFQQSADDKPSTLRAV